MINMRHELVKLSELIDWECFEREWLGFFPSEDGRPATHPWLVAGLMYLQHVCRLADDAVVARWIENRNGSIGTTFLSWVCCFNIIIGVVTDVIWTAGGNVRHRARSEQPNSMGAIHPTGRSCDHG